jgi:hypothetical protein
MGLGTGAADLDLDRRYTLADLESLPEDGRRYELADGWLIVSPMARRLHQLAGLGIQSCWLVDVDVPSVRVLELRAGAYAEVAFAEGDAVIEVDRPFPVRLVTAD